MHLSATPETFKLSGTPRLLHLRGSIEALRRLNAAIGPELIRQLAMTAQQRVIEAESTMGCSAHENEYFCGCPGREWDETE